MTKIKIGKKYKTRGSKSNIIFKCIAFNSKNLPVIETLDSGFVFTLPADYSRFEEYTPPFEGKCFITIGIRPDGCLYVLSSLEEFPMTSYKVLTQIVVPWTEGQAVDGDESMV